jgi:hypothetical protein
VFYSASNAKLKVNDHEILASNAQLSLNARVEPNYVAGARHSQTFNASNGIEGQLNFNYYLTGADYFKSFITGQGEVKDYSAEVVDNPISGNFGGLNFDSGYLASYSVNFSPNAPAMASASVSFFDELKGTFVSAPSPPPSSTEVLNFSNAVVSSVFEEDEVDNFVEGTFNYNSNVEAVYLAGETKPSRVSFGVKSINMNFEIDNPTGNLPVSGSAAQIEVALKKFNNVDMPVTSWTLRGSPYNLYSTFDTDGSSITSAIKTNNAGECSNPAYTNQTDCENNGGTWTPANYAIADSSSFVVNDGEQFKIDFSLTINTGPVPKIQLISSNLLAGNIGEGWSNIQGAGAGVNSITLTASPVGDASVIGTGNYGMIQIYNSTSEAADWELSDLKVTRVLTVPSELFACSGVMQSRNIASTVGAPIRQTIGITQSNSAVNQLFVAYLITPMQESIPIDVPVLL